MGLAGEPIVILGSYRSGTSSMAATLVHLGMYMGSAEALFPADEFNPDGHWELKDMMATHERLLMAFRSSYFAATWLPESWHDHPLLEAMIRELRALLEKNFRGKTCWGWKEPATSILLPLYKEALAQEGLAGRYLICVRHPKAVVASMMRRFVATPMDGVNFGANDYPGAEERLMAMWVSYMLSSLRETKGRPRLMVSYEKYLRQPDLYVGRISENLLTWAPSQPQFDSAIAAIKPRLSHSSIEVEERLEGWPDLVNCVYELCLRANDDPAGFASGTYDPEIDSLWLEWVRLRRMIQPITLPGGQMSFSWMESGATQRFAEAYVPTIEGDRLRFETACPGGAEIHIDAFQTPCQIWLKEAKWVSRDGEYPAKLNAGPGGILEDISGAQRLTVFGPGSLIASTPPGSGPYSFEIEVLVQYDQAVLTRVVAALAQRAVQLQPV